MCPLWMAPGLQGINCGQCRPVAGTIGLATRHDCPDGPLWRERLRSGRCDFCCSPRKRTSSGRTDQSSALLFGLASGAAYSFFTCSMNGAIALKALPCSLLTFSPILSNTKKPSFVLGDKSIPLNTFIVEETSPPESTAYLRLSSRWRPISSYKTKLTKHQGPPPHRDRFSSTTNAS
jgi:hypothetical protein